MKNHHILISSMKFSEKLIELQQTQNQINDHISFSIARAIFAAHISKTGCIRMTPEEEDNYTCFIANINEDMPVNVGLVRSKLKEISNNLSLNLVNTGATCCNQEEIKLGDTTVVVRDIPEYKELFQVLNQAAHRLVGGRYGHHTH